MLQQIQTKYMIALRQGTDIRPEDLGAVRLAMRMALEELHLQYRHDLADMDDIIADLLQERDQLKTAAATDAGEILRLQTMEDRLVSWLNAHEPVTNCDDVAAVIIDVLTKYRANGATLVPATRTIPVEHFTVNGNGNGNGRYGRKYERGILAYVESIDTHPGRDRYAAAGRTPAAAAQG